MLPHALTDASRLKVVFFNLGGGPAPSGDGFVFTEGGLVHAVHSFVPLTDSCDVTVICPNVPPGSEGRSYDFRGVRVVCPPGVPLPPGIHPGELSFTERRFATLLQGPTLAANYVRTVRDTRRGKPSVVLANGILGSYLLSRNRRHAPVIAVIHHLYHDARTTGSQASTGGLTARLEMMLLRRLSVDGVAVVNPTVRQRLIECGMDPERVVCVGNGVDVNQYAFTAAKPGMQLTFVGRLRRLKCVDRVIDAFAIVHRKQPEAVLHIAGDGPMRRSLEHQAAALGLAGSVVFHGFLPEDAKVALLRDSAVYLSASQFEGFGIPLVEAMAAGAVPVASDIPSHGFIFQDRQVGFLARTPEEMAERTLQVLEDSALRERMAREGRDLVCKTWTWEAVALRYRALIDSVLASRR
jgi:glycosyltransferase involved in cell wall biosynthesis